MREYKDKNWLKNNLIDKERSMSEIAIEFNVDIDTVEYWRDKFGLKSQFQEILKSNIKYPIEDFICPVCGKEFSKRVTKECQTMYCSKECAYKGRSLGFTKRKVKNGYNTNRTKIKKNCAFCDKEFTFFKGENRKYCSRNCFYSAHRKNMLANKNPSWNGGSSYEKRSYRGYNWERQRKLCFERDEYTCQICGNKCISRRDLDDNNGGKLIQAHHIIDYNESKSNRLSNLLTLCASCHKKVHEGVVKIEVD